MKIVDTITLAELRLMAERMYGTMIKADVDVAKKIVVIDPAIRQQIIDIIAGVVRE